MIYFASKVQHAAKWRALDTKYDICSTWIYQPFKLSSKDEAKQLWVDCLGDIERCDVIIAYREEGEVMKGALIEIGAALALRKPVYLVNYLTYGGSWTCHPLVKHCKTVEEALLCLKD